MSQYLLGKAVASEMVSIHDEDYPLGNGQPIGSQGQVGAPIVIGDRVWVGAKATILRGTWFGDYSVIGANAVVTRDVPANAMATGNPAREWSTSCEAQRRGGCGVCGFFFSQTSTRLCWEA